MDQTNCSTFYATDRIFLRTPVGTCNVNLFAPWSIGVVMIIVRFLVAASRSRSGLRSVNPKDSPATRHLKLFAHVFLPYMSAISLAVTCPLLLANFANVDNGWSFSVYSMVYSFFVLRYSVMLFSLVKLGRNAIKVSSDQNLGDTQHLARFTSCLRFGIVVQTTMAVLSSVSLIVLSPIIPEYDLVLGSIGFATKAAFQIICTAGLLYQFERCVRTLKAHASPISNERTKIDSAIEIIRYRQAYLAFFPSVVALVFILLATSAVPWTWEWVLLGTTGPETISTLLYECVIARKHVHDKKPPSHASNKQRLNDDDDDLTLTTVKKDPAGGHSGSLSGQRQRKLSPLKDPESSPADETVDILTDIAVHHTSPSQSTTSLGMRYNKYQQQKRVRKEKKRRKQKKTWNLDLTRVTEEPTQVVSTMVAPQEHDEEEEEDTQPSSFSSSSQAGPMIATTAVENSQDILAVVTEDPEQASHLRMSSSSLPAADAQRFDV